MRTFLFYLFSAAGLLSAYFVVTINNLFRAALGLIAMLLSIAGLYLLLDAQFLSAVQVTVYIGGIVVLIVYVVLLVADAVHQEVHEALPWRKAVAGILAAAVFVVLAVAIFQHPFEATPGLVERSASVAEIGAGLLSPERNGFVLPFEVISLVLVAAIVGAITIAHGGSSDQSK
jgi:NADH-quinone oxidoreductase subunit J